VSLDLEFTILLPEGGVFRFAGPFPVSSGQWEHIHRVMEAMAPGLVAVANQDNNRRAPPLEPCGPSPCMGSDVRLASSRMF
jgi:hypothetical protein